MESRKERKLEKMVIPSEENGMPASLKNIGKISSGNRVEGMEIDKETTTVEAPKQKRKTPAELRLEQLKRARTDSLAKSNSLPASKDSQDGFSNPGSSNLFAKEKKSILNSSLSTSFLNNPPVRMEGSSFLDAEISVDEGAFQERILQRRVVAPCFAKHKGVKVKRESVVFKTITNSSLSSQKEDESSILDNDFLSKALSVSLPPDENFCVPTEKVLTMTENGELGQQIFNLTEKEKGNQDPNFGIKLLPIDWSLKRTAKFSSQLSFDWCQNVSPLEGCCGLQMFVQSVNDVSNQMFFENFIKNAQNSNSQNTQNFSQHCSQSFSQNVSQNFSQNFSQSFSKNFAEISQSSESFRNTQNTENTEDSENTKTCSQISRNSEKNRLKSSEFCKSLYSWVHPNTSFPPSLLLSLTSAAAKGGQDEKKFISKRKAMWVEAFQSLYWMFRQGLCHMFYVCGQNSVAMFHGGGIAGAPAGSFSAYLSRSSRGLRAVLAEQDVSFSMPLCGEKMTSNNIEEIHELREFEKSHPGQTKLVDSCSAVDNSPESILFMEDKTSVHGLFNFILNFRHLMGPTVGGDEPLLLSPISFKNSSVHSPEVVCRRLQRAESSDVIGGEFNTKSNNKNHNKVHNNPKMGVSYNLELSGSLLPPWVTSRVCSVLQKYHLLSFSGSFTTENLTDNFNIFPRFSQNSESQENFSSLRRERESEMEGAREEESERVTGGAFSSEELKNWRKKCVLSRTVFRQIKCKDRLFTVSVM